MPSAGSLTLTDGRLAVLLTEYAELGERLVASERAHEGNERGTPARSHSLAHYHNRHAEDLGGRRAAILRELEARGMSTNHWVGYGNRAALLAESPPGYPDRLQLHDCLWCSLQSASEQEAPIEIVRASRKLEYRNSLSGPRRALMEVYENAGRNHSVPSIAGFLVFVVGALVCALAGYLLTPSPGALVCGIFISGVGGVAAGNLLDRTHREQLAGMEAELLRRERRRIPEPAEKVHVRRWPAEVEYPEPGAESPVGEGQLDVRFAAAGKAVGRQARVALNDVRPAVNGHAATMSDGNRACEMADSIRQTEHGETGASPTQR